jgi:anti-sigma regulatory factor (Ser/Thr protein kinase)
MRAGRRSLGLAATIVLLGVVVVVGLAVITVVAFPVALVIELGVLALVAGVASRATTRRRRRRARDSDPLWVTRWESEPPVEAVPLTRRQLSGVLGEWGLTGEAHEDVLLVVTELLSNAVDHGRGPVRLTVELRGGSVRVEVHDTAPGPPRPQPLDPYAVRGRGLQMVEALSSEWGWSDRPVGKIVWADVPTA